MATNGSSDPSDFIYHVVQYIIDYQHDKSGATRNTDILGTYTDLMAAKSAARQSLLTEGLNKSEFETYEENDGQEGWKHGDGVVVYAKAQAGGEIEIRIDTEPNTYHLKGNASCLVEGHLHYVLQTKIDYNIDRSGGTQSTQVEGTYATRKVAFEAAKTVLLSDSVDRDWFVEYMERDEEKDDWPYGDDVLVNAASATGEIFKVEVKAQPGSHLKHAKRTKEQ